MRGPAWEYVAVGVLGTLLTVSSAVFVDRELPDHDLYKAGDLLLAGMFPRSRQMIGTMCGPKKSAISVQGATAMRYAIDELSRSQEILPNITLGYIIMDDCNREAVALAKTLQLIPVKDCVRNACGAANLPEHVLTAGRNRQFEVVGVVGPFGSTLQMRTSLLMSFYQIPHISWIATSDTLSDKSLYGYFSRVVPPDRYQARALVDILQSYGWTYVSTLYSEGTYGSTGIGHVRRAMKDIGICTAYSAELRNDYDDADYDNIARNIKRYPKAKVIIMFVESRHGRKFLLALHRADAIARFVILATEGFGSNVLRDIPQVKRNMMSLVLVAGTSKEFLEFYKKGSPFGGENPIWQGEYDARGLGCTWDGQDPEKPSCHRYATFNDVPDHTVTNWPVRIMDVVHTFGRALHSLIVQNCPNAFQDKGLLANCVNGSELLRHIRLVKFPGISVDIEFDELGDLVGGSYMIFTPTQSGGKFVGNWQTKSRKVSLNESLIEWWERSADGGFVPRDSPPESVCAKPCGIGEFYLMGELTCCWECRRCRDNERLRTNLRGCDTCPLNSWPDQVNFTTCEEISPTYMRWTDPIAIGLAGLSGGLILVTILIIGVFIQHRQRKVIKGSSRELMAPIIVGLLLAFASVFLFIARAGDWRCFANYIGFNISCTFIFGPLFLKMLRVYRIFAAAEKCKTRVRGVDSSTQVVAILIILALEAGILTAMCIYDGPRAVVNMPVVTLRHVELSCRLPLINLLSPLCYNIVLLVLCAVFGFLTRKLPDNFNESWYVFISVTTTLFVWIAFLPTYFMAFYAYHKAALVGLALILNGAVTLLCLFAPKIYALYFVDDKGIKVTNFDFDEPTQSSKAPDSG